MNYIPGLIPSQSRFDKSHVCGKDSEGSIIEKMHE
jgi:hypothetical protein